MSGAIYALAACFLASIGARDQVLLAALTAKQGWRGTLVAVALATGVCASAMAALVAREGLGQFDHKVQLIMAVIGLALAGGESLLRRPRRVPKEPTRSLLAAMLVLLADQSTDPARFVILAFTIATGDPLAAALGGTVGASTALLLGAMHAETMLRHKRLFVWVRRLAGLLLLTAAAAVFLWDYLVVAHS